MEQDSARPGETSEVGGVVAAQALSELRSLCGERSVRKHMAAVARLKPERKYKRRRAPTFADYERLEREEIMAQRGISKDMLPAQAGAAHDALADARWIRDAHVAMGRMA